MTMRLVPVLVVIIFVYIGNVLGNAVLCETVPELAKAKKFVWFIPFFQIIYLVRLIITVQNNKLVLLYRYLRIPHKNIMVSYAFAQASKDVAAKRKQNPEWNVKAKGKRHFWEYSMTNYSQTIMNAPQS